MKQNTLRIKRDTFKNKSYFIIYTEENESGDADFFISPGTYPVHVVIGSIEIKDCIVYLYDESGKQTQHIKSENIEKKTYTKIDVTDSKTNYNDSFMQAQKQILYATVPVVEENTQSLNNNARETQLLFDEKQKEKELEEATKLMEAEIKKKEEEEEARKLVMEEIKKKEEELESEGKGKEEKKENVFWFIVKFVVILFL